MIDQIGSPIIALELRELEVRWDRFLHDAVRERRVGTYIITMRGGSMAEFLDLSVHLLQFLVQEILSIADL